MRACHRQRRKSLSHTASLRVIDLMSLTCGSFEQTQTLERRTARGHFDFETSHDSGILTRFEACGFASTRSDRGATALHGLMTRSGSHGRRSAWPTRALRTASVPAYIYIYIYTHTYIYIYIYIYTHMYMYVDAISPSRSLSLFLYIHTYIYIYIHTSRDQESRSRSSGGFHLSRGMLAAIRMMVIIMK